MARGEEAWISTAWKLNVRMAQRRSSKTCKHNSGSTRLGKRGEKRTGDGRRRGASICAAFCMYHILTPFSFPPSLLRMITRPTAKQQPTPPRFTAQIHTCLVSLQITKRVLGKSKTKVNAVCIRGYINEQWAWQAKKRAAWQQRTEPLGKDRSPPPNSLLVSLLSLLENDET